MQNPQSPTGVVTASGAASYGGRPSIICHHNDSFVAETISFWAIPILEDMRLQNQLTYRLFLL